MWQYLAGGLECFLHLRILKHLSRNCCSKSGDIDSSWFYVKPSSHHNKFFANNTQSSVSQPKPTASHCFGAKAESYCWIFSERTLGWRFCGGQRGIDYSWTTNMVFASEEGREREKEIQSGLKSRVHGKFKIFILPPELYCRNHVWTGDIATHVFWPAPNTCRSCCQSSSGMCYRALCLQVAGPMLCGSVRFKSFIRCMHWNPATHFHVFLYDVPIAFSIFLHNKSVLVSAYSCMHRQIGMLGSYSIIF